MPYQSYRKSTASFFWPIIIIGAGVVWLLSDLNIIPSENLWILLRLWPVLLIVAGLDVLFARRLPLLGALLALLVITGVIYVLMDGSMFDLEGSRPEPQVETFVVEVDDVMAVNFDLNLSTQDTKVSRMAGSTHSVEAEISHYGDIGFTVTGDEEKRIRLAQTGLVSWFSWLMPALGEGPLMWDIGLSPRIPFDLEVDASSGRVEMDLRGIQLDRLRFDGGTGASTIYLPASTEAYDARLEGGTGTLEVNLPARGNINLRLDGSTGRILFALSETTQVQVQVLGGGVGDLLTTERISKVSGAQGRDEGVYQTEGFEDAPYQLVIIIEDIGTGNIIVE